MRRLIAFVGDWRRFGRLCKIENRRGLMPVVRSGCNAEITRRHDSRLEEKMVRIKYHSFSRFISSSPSSVFPSTSLPHNCSTLYSSPPYSIRYLLSAARYPRKNSSFLNLMAPMFRLDYNIQVKPLPTSTYSPPQSLSITNYHLQLDTIKITEKVPQPKF